jgi:RNA polymerase sigma factor (sigma-70 family)
MQPLAEVLTRALQVAAKAATPELTDGELLRRFAGRDEGSFATLVARHAGMVLGVCRRSLPTVQDAEDACQATFLVLVQKARRQRWQPSVANWLYTTARRVAAKARLSAERRSVRERKAARPEGASCLEQMTGREAFAALDEELERLPPIYREPLVLCYLEGLTRDEAAARVGAPLATLKSQLARARKKLGDALTRRGCGLGAGLLALAVTSPAGASSPRLAQAILAAVSGAPPAAVAALAKGASVNALVNKSMLAVFALVAASLFGAGLVAWQPPAASAPPEKAPPAKQAPANGKAKPPADDKGKIAYSGRVLGPDGRPVAGAKLYVALGYGGYAWRPVPSPEYGTTGRDGRFQFTLPKTKFGDEPTAVAAMAANYGAGWVSAPGSGKRADLTIRLVKDDVPITGQIVDLEGKPVPGVTLRVLQINAAPREDLGPWLEAARTKEGLSLALEQKYIGRYTLALSPKATTDAQGRFRLTGIGRNRLVRAQIDGPTVASQQLHILTRPGKAIEVTEYQGRPGLEPRRATIYYGANFKFAALPTTPIVGLVRDKDTKKPLAGVTVESYKLANNPYHGADIVQTTTDARGRYRLTGMPRGKGNKIRLLPPRDLPYVSIHTEVPDNPGLGTVTVDVELKRGVWIEGKITDKVTGKPLRGLVQYFSLASNPHLGDYPGFGATHQRGCAGKEDGSYRVAGLPGPGLVVVYRKANYLEAPDREDEYGATERYLLTAPHVLFFLTNYSALARVSPAKGAEKVVRDVALEPGWAFKATVLGPDGKPLAGARVFGLPGMRWAQSPRMETAELMVHGFNPHRPRAVFFQHPEKRLVGIAAPPKKNGDPVTVRMGPGAEVTGRLVDADGKPRPRIELKMWFRTKKGRELSHVPEGIKTDGEGRFRIPAVVPGYELGLTDGQGEASFSPLRSGEMKHLGDVKIGPAAKKE